jgi:hypothetical protein
MTVFALGQTPPLYSASTQMLVTVQTYAPPDPKVLFELGYKGPANPGSTIQLDSNFTNIGNAQLVITGLRFGGEFGSFSEPSGFPLSIFPGQKKTLSLNMTISPGTSLGSHRISSTSTWEYYVPDHYNATTNQFYPSRWTAGNDIVVNGSIAVVTNTPFPFGPLAATVSLAIRNPAVIAGVIVYAILVTLASTLVIRNDHRKVRKLAKTRPS